MLGQEVSEVDRHIFIQQYFHFVVAGIGSALVIGKDSNTDLICSRVTLGNCEMK